MRALSVREFKAAESRVVSWFGGGNCAFWGRLQKINYFFSAPLLPSSAGSSAHKKRAAGWLPFFYALSCVDSPGPAS
jgi:hypothetical protein